MFLVQLQLLSVMAPQKSSTELDLAIWCISSVYNFSKVFWGMRKFSFHSSETSETSDFWLQTSSSQYELVCPGRIQNVGEFLLPFSLEDFEMVDEMIL